MLMWNITFKVEQDELLQYGLTAGQLVMMLSPTTQEEVLTTIEKDGHEMKVIVQQEQAEQPKSIRRYSRYTCGDSTWDNDATL